MRPFLTALDWRGSPGRDRMSSPVSSIRNLGPASEAAFARAGIRSAEELRALGADEAYLRLLRNGEPAHFIGYYVLVMALQGRPWNDCKGAEKDRLRKSFDALKAQVVKKGRSDLEAALDMLGVVERREAPARSQPTSSRPEKK